MSILKRFQDFAQPGSRVVILSLKIIRGERSKRFDIAGNGLQARIVLWVVGLPDFKMWVALQLIFSFAVGLVTTTTESLPRPFTLLVRDLPRSTPRDSADREAKGQLTDLVRKLVINLLQH